MNVIVYLFFCGMAIATMAGIYVPDDWQKVQLVHTFLILGMLAVKS